LSQRQLSDPFPAKYLIQTEPTKENVAGGVAI
jgi:hypothetical protein